MRESGTKMRIGDVTLNVVDQGAGVPVLLLHGFPDSADLWREVVPQLVTAGCRCIVPDLRGFGDSDAPRGASPYALDQVVADIVGLLDALGVARCHVVGHDWGSVIGWMLAARHPGRIATLVAVSVGHPASFRGAGFEQKLRSWYVLAVQAPGLAELAIRAWRFALLRGLTSGHPEADHWIADLERPGRLSAALAWYRANFVRLLTASVPSVRVPVLGVWSTGDVALAEDQMTGSQCFVDAAFRYERLEGVSHWIPLDAPERLAALVLEWVSPARRQRRASADLGAAVAEPAGMHREEQPSAGPPVQAAAAAAASRRNSR